MEKDIFLKMYDCEMTETVIIDENVVEILYEFIKDRSAYDYYCNKCNKIKTYVQKEKQAVLVDSSFYNYQAINMYWPKLENTVISYNKSEYSTLANDSSTININENSSRIFVFKRLECPTCNEKIIMIFLYENKAITKIYQSFISEIIRDEDIQKFRRMKLLSESDLKELEKANRCKKMGMNVASFVYMRRIFENMLQRIYEEHKSEITIKDSSKNFTDLFVKDKVKLLKPYLPILLNEDSTSEKYIKIYKLLSEGIHKLNEEICESLYNIIKDILIMILEKEVEKRKNDKNLVELEKNFNKIFN